MATIYEVSELAGVSLATVSRVMNGTANVSARTQEKVRSAMEGLGYVPSSAAISLASKRSNCIGILVGELDSVFFGSMMQGIENELRAYSKHAVITTGHPNVENEKLGIEFLKSRDCDALIIYAESLSDEYLIELCKGKTPVFVINRNIEEIASRCIILDNFLGGYIATQNVVENGHVNIVHISGPTTKNDANQRFDGNKKALEEGNLVFSAKETYEGDYMQESGGAAIDHFIANNIKFTAVVCANDQMAIGAMARLREHNLEPGVDVSIIGFDDVKFASCTFPKLTTVKYPIKEMGKAAACMALKEVYNKKVDVIGGVFKPSLIERDSVRKVFDN